MTDDDRFARRRREALYWVLLALVGTAVLLGALTR